jgi:proteasome component ECM29
LLNSPNPAKLSAANLSERLASSLLPLVVKANSTHAKDVHLMTFTSISSVFEHAPEGLSLGDTQAKTALEKILFEPTYEGLPEAMRLKRAEALVAVARIHGCEWVAEKARPEMEGTERSAAVKGILAQIGNK